MMIQIKNAANCPGMWYAIELMQMHMGDDRVALKFNSWNVTIAVDALHTLFSDVTQLQTA